MDLSELSVTEIAALGGLGFALLMFGIAIIRSMREPTLRIAGISLVVSLALMANNAAVYFAAVFIIATGLTSLEFLEKLAAIITRSSPYFDYLSTASQMVPPASGPQELGSTSTAAVSNEESAGPDAEQPNDLDGEGQRQALINAARDLIGTSRLDEGISLADKALEMNPFDPMALQTKGELLRGQGRYLEALDMADRAIQSDPSYYWTYGTRAAANTSLNRLDDAVRDATRAIELNPDYQFALAFRAHTYRLQGRFEDAISDASRAMELGGNIAWLLAIRAETFRQLGRFEEALRDANAAIETNPTIPGAHGTRAAVHMMQGKLADAVRDASQEIEATPRLGWSYAVRAEAYRRLGRFKDAIRDAGKALQLDPTDKFAATILEKSLDQKHQP